MSMKHLVLVFLVCSGMALADARQLDDYQWEGVDRIIAIGDVHGDYANYLATLQAAGLVDRKGKWIGGKAHLVQTGDIPDRGPDTEKIIEHLDQLAKQAQRKGGQVHSLIGNHEAMNVYGDLRYVHAGEYRAFVTRKSEGLRDRYYEIWLQNIETQDPETFAQLPPDIRERWNQEHPLGWVEHRQAWSPSWNPEGKYATWVLDKKVAIRINGAIFLHGGISGFYCRNSLDWITEKVRAGLRAFDPNNSGILEDEFGPLWYRGLSGVEPTASPETVDAILEHHGVSHIVVGHTPTSGIVWPNYDSKVVMIDTGIARHYGGYVAYLEITPEGLYAGYPSAKFPLPSTKDGVVAYLEQVIELNPENPHLRQRLEQLLQPPVPAAPADAGAPARSPGEPASSSESSVPGEPAQPVIPTCGIAE
jgi:hypothetical protein